MQSVCTNLRNSYVLTIEDSVKSNYVNYISYVAVWMLLTDVGSQPLGSLHGTSREILFLGSYVRLGYINDTFPSLT